jgi:hypothetical protein
MPLESSITKVTYPASSKVKGMGIGGFGKFPVVSVKVCELIEKVAKENRNSVNIFFMIIKDYNTFYAEC